MKGFLSRLFLFIVFFGSTSLTINAQEGWEDIQDRESYLSVSELTEGIYKTFKEFKSNSPSITTDFELRRQNLFFKDTSNTWLPINENNIWGCVKGGNIYIAKGDGVWKCLDVGRLLQFGTKHLKTVMMQDPMNGSQMVEVIKQYFLDTETNQIYLLNSRNIKLYVEHEPDLNNYKMDRKLTKEVQTVLYLKAFNELNPLKIKPNE